MELYHHTTDSNLIRLFLRVSLAESVPGSLSIGRPDDGSNVTHIRHLSFGPRGFNYIGNATPTLLPRRIVLKDIVNRSVTYQPPFYDAVTDLQSSLPDECQKAIAYYATYINEAERFLA
jgi:hypothetical protein